MSSKGTSFEREICTILSRWWSRGKRADIFYRTDGSGGRATNRRKRGLSTVNSCGDVGALDPVGLPLLRLFVIELKRGYSKSTIHDLIDRPTKKSKPLVYDEWITKAEREAKEAKSHTWLIVHRRDFHGPMVLIGSGKIANLLLCKGSNYDSIVVSSAVRPGDWMVQLSLSDFLRIVSPVDVRKLVEALSQPKEDPKEEE
jgi:hypothetical protein